MKVKPYPSGLKLTRFARSGVDRVYEQVQVSLMNAIRRGTITRIDANQQFWHEVWVRVSEELGLQYQREEWGDE